MADDAHNCLGEIKQDYFSGDQGSAWSPGFTLKFYHFPAAGHMLRGEGGNKLLKDDHAPENLKKVDLP
jgi:hypothetical protein